MTAVLAFRMIQGRSAEFAARLTCRLCCAGPTDTAWPAVVWKRVRALIDAARPGTVGSDELLELAEEEIEKLTRALAGATTREREAEDVREELVSNVDELLGVADDLRGEVRFLRSNL